MLKEYLFLLLLLALLPNTLLAQVTFEPYLLGSIGAEISTTSGELSLLQSMGSIAGTTVYGSGGRFVQGFVQDTYCGDCKTLTSVVNPAIKAELHFFPNPAYDLLHVVGDTEILHRYQIFDAHGKVVGDGQFNGAPISLQKLSAGVYMFRFLTPSGRWAASTKIIKL